MANLFLISDTHFGHPLMVKLRGFSSPEEMDELMIERWNKVVKPQDHVYHLGDVVINKFFLGHIKRLNGKKRLIFGNHDIFPYQKYAEAGFEKLMAYRVLDGMIFSHIPIGPGSLERFKVNVHGHLHDNVVTIGAAHPAWSKRDEPDPRYVNVCVERINYEPISLEELKKRIIT